jgi:hypothetical protein
VLPSSCGGESGSVDGRGLELHTAIGIAVASTTRYEEATRSATDDFSSCGPLSRDTTVDVMDATSRWVNGGLTRKLEGRSPGSDRGCSR